MSEDEHILPEVVAGPQIDNIAPEIVEAARKHLQKKYDEELAEKECPRAPRSEEHATNEDFIGAWTKWRNDLDNELFRQFVIWDDARLAKEKRKDEATWNKCHAIFLFIEKEKAIFRQWAIDQVENHGKDYNTEDDSIEYLRNNRPPVSPSSKDFANLDEYRRAVSEWQKTLGNKEETYFKKLILGREQSFPKMTLTKENYYKDSLKLDDACYWWEREITNKIHVLKSCQARAQENEDYHFKHRIDIEFGTLWIYINRRGKI